MMLQKICNFLMTILLIILVLLAGVMFLPKVFDYKSLAVLSGSMEPGIPVGSIVYAKETDPTTLQVGDVVTYRLNGDTLVTHRVAEINKEEQTVVTKGDANDNVDGEPVAYSDILGKVAFHLPWIGYISIYIKTPVGIAAVCGVLILIILLNFLPEIFKHEEEEEKKKK